MVELSGLPFRAGRPVSRQPRPRVLAPEPVPSDLFIDTLGDLVRCRTVSDPIGGKVASEAFGQLEQVLVDRFPSVHQTLSRDAVSAHSLLYEWRGLEPGLPPILLCTHADVVPAETEADAGWSHPPFDGQIVEGALWGRGAIDDKARIAGILTGIEDLIGRGFRPRRTIFVAIGHDEEVGGGAGAAEMARLLAGRGVRLDVVLDEGGLVTHGLVPGVRRPVALIGIGEKGFLTIELTAHGPTGHSMMPPRRSAVSTLAGAITRLEASPLPVRTEGVRRLYRWLAPELPVLQGLVMGNLKLFDRVLARRLAAKPHTNATIRTTISATMLQAGQVPNVVPSTARAALNVRLLPGDRARDIAAYVQRVVGDRQVGVRMLDPPYSAEAPPESSTESAAFHALAQTIRDVFPDALVAPWVLIGATDSRHYVPLAANIYRFAPIRLRGSDVFRIHGRDERLEVDQAADIVRFYRELLRALAG